jgi:hypothetical protein
LARHYPTRSRTLGLGFAIATLAFAACGHSNTTPKPTPTITPVFTAGPSSQPCILSVGIAYEPDGGNGNGFHGIQVSHFQGNDEKTCAGVGPTATPMGLAFQSSVSELTFDVDAVDSVAVLQNGSAGYSLIQDIFGATVGQLVPAGTPYNVDAPPPTPAVTSTATPLVAPLIPDVTSVSIVGNGQSGVALTVGPAASPPALVALTSLTFAPPQYGLNAPFSGPNYTLPNPVSFPRTIVRISPGATTAGTSIALVRGQNDLLSFQISLVGSGYQFNLVAQNLALGTGTALRGNGNIAFDPADVTRVLLGGTTAGGSNVLTLIDGLPAAITPVSSLTLPIGATVHSIEIASNGQFAVVGTDVGIFVVNGVNSTTLSLVSPPFSRSPLSSLANAIPYTNCNGTASMLTTIYSIGLSAGAVPGFPLNDYLVALGTANGVSCPSGNNATLVALPFSPTTGTTPAPTAAPSPTAVPSGTPAPPSPTPPAIFVQNNMIAPPSGSDILIVR